jgi:hypothetical protein
MATLMSATLFMLLCSAEQAQDLYDNAHYDEALALLTDCSDVACERLRGFAHAALGQDAAAEAAFFRWRVRDPNAVLAESTSPKLLQVFARAQDRAVRIEHSVLEVTPSGDVWTLRVMADAGVTSVVVVLLGVEVLLRRDGDAWVGEAALRPGSYRLRLELGTNLAIVTAARDLVLPSGVDPAVASPPAQLGPWAFWGLVGGGVALVAGATATYFALREERGTLYVGVTLAR